MDCFIGEIRLMAFPLAPAGWAYCQGQLLPIAQYRDLYALLGTTYGGDGTTTFGLPDLRGRVVVGAGQGAGLSPYALGQQGGQQQVPLQASHLPRHEHNFEGTLVLAEEVTTKRPAGAYPTAASGPAATPYSTGVPDLALSSAALPMMTTLAGESLPHENRQPVLALNYAIALAGVAPTRA